MPMEPTASPQKPGERATAVGAEADATPLSGLFII
jgi:hypothetical protein